MKHAGLALTFRAVQIAILIYVIVVMKNDGTYLKYEAVTGTGDWCTCHYFLHHDVECMWHQFPLP